MTQIETIQKTSPTPEAEGTQTLLEAYETGRTALRELPEQDTPTLTVKDIESPRTGKKYRAIEARTPTGDYSVTIRLGQAVRDPETTLPMPVIGLELVRGDDPYSLFDVRYLPSPDGSVKASVEGLHSESRFTDADRDFIHSIGLGAAIDTAEKKLNNYGSDLNIYAPNANELAGLGEIPERFMTHPGPNIFTAA